MKKIPEVIGFVEVHGGVLDRERTKKERWPFEELCGVRVAHVFPGAGCSEPSAGLLLSTASVVLFSLPLFWNDRACAQRWFPLRLRNTYPVDDSSVPLFFFFRAALGGGRRFHYPQHVWSPAGGWWAEYVGVLHFLHA